MSMIKYTGAGPVWDGTTVHGNEGQNRANVGIHITKLQGGGLDTGKICFPAISIDDCGTAIKFDGSGSADSCAFGYYWPHDCDVAVQLTSAAATMFTFRYIHPLSLDKVFEVTGGGRIYVHSVNVVSGVETLLDIQRGDLTNSFFHINGVTGDGNNTDYYLLKNTDDGDALTHVRFTNAHLTIPQDFG